MKRLVLLLALFIFSFTNAQKMDKDFLEGAWETEFHTVEFKTINKKELKITIILKETNEAVDILSYQFNKNNLYIETYYKPNDWKAIGKLVIIDKDTMAEDIVSGMPGILIYKRKLNN